MHQNYSQAWSMGKSIRCKFHLHFIFSDGVCLQSGRMTRSSKTHPRELSAQVPTSRAWSTRRTNPSIRWVANTKAPVLREIHPTRLGPTLITFLLRWSRSRERHLVLSLRARWTPWATFLVQVSTSKTSSRRVTTSTAWVKSCRQLPMREILDLGPTTIRERLKCLRLSLEQVRDKVLGLTRVLQVLVSTTLTTRSSKTMLQDMVLAQSQEMLRP